MTVTGIEPFGQNRSKVYLDEEFAFVLYKGELSRYGIREDAELPEETYREITDEVLTHRAKLRCMNLLKSMDRTEEQLRQKLRMGGYPPEVIDTALDYVKSFGYVNDASYAERYITGRRESCSRLQMTRDLMMKGLDRDVIEAAFDEQEPLDEDAQIQRWLEKKGIDPEHANQKEKRRMYGFLMRKGFSSDSIWRALCKNSP